MFLYANTSQITPQTVLTIERLILILSILLRRPVPIFGKIFLYKKRKKDYIIAYNTLLYHVKAIKRLFFGLFYFFYNFIQIFHFFASIIDFYFFIFIPSLIFLSGDNTTCSPSLSPFITSIISSLSRPFSICLSLAVPLSFTKT